MHRALIVLVLLGLTACGNKAVYEGIRINQENECIKEPPPIYRECMERTNKSYREYERERKELLQKGRARDKVKKDDLG